MSLIRSYLHDHGIYPMIVQRSDMYFRGLVAFPNSAELGLSIAKGGSIAHLSLVTGAEGGTMIGVGCGPAVYLTLPIRSGQTTRVSGVRVSTDYDVPGVHVTAELGANTGWSQEQQSWSRLKRLTQGYGLKRHIDLLDVIFGKPVLQRERVARANRVQLAMPEGAYRVNVTVERSRVVRPRARMMPPWSYSGAITMKRFVPTIGRRGPEESKGATFPLTGDVYLNAPRLVERTLREYASYILAERALNAGGDWVPEDGWPKHCRRH